MLVNPFFFGMVCKFVSFVTFSSKKGSLTCGQTNATPQLGFSVTLSQKKCFPFFFRVGVVFGFFFSFLGGWGVAVGWLTFVNFSCSLEEQDSSFQLSEPLHIITWHWPTRILKNIKLPFSKVLYHRFVLAGLVGNTLSVSEIKFNFEQHFLFPVMAGQAPEGSQFDARQFDSKMNDL